MPLKQKRSDKIANLRFGSVLFHKALMTELKNMEKQTLNFDLIKVVIENDRIEDSVIDIMIGRFPHLVTDIFKELDDQTLATCRNVSRLFCDYLDNEKILWVRIIQSYRNYTGSSYPDWNKVLKNTSVEFVKELSVATQNFYKETRTDFHWSPLQVVAEQGNLELCKYILEKNKNTKPCIKYNHPLLMAAKKGREEICKFLFDNSEEKNPSDVDGMTLFHFAAERGLTNVCKLIIENIDNKNPAALNGCTPLHLAAKGGHLKIVRLIVETGVNKNSLFDGMTPLNFAGSYPSYTLFKLLGHNTAHLCYLIFTDLLFCFFGMIFMSFFISYLIIGLLEMYHRLTCGLDCKWIYDTNMRKVYLVHPSLLVGLVIGFPLTVIIRVCNGIFRI